MNENLKVNSKTDILEFKRKHNLLVENGTIKANVSNIKTLSNDVINNLRCGDVVLKEDASGKHAYLVSFKSDTGLCLTYCDASCVETQSYDKVEGNWVYNSEDKWEMTKPIYCHPISLIQSDNTEAARITCLIFNNSPTPFTLSTFVDWIDNLYTQVGETIRIMISGSYKESTDIYIGSYMGKSSEGYYLAGCKVSTGGYAPITFATKELFVARFNQFNDGVNRIN